MCTTLRVSLTLSKILLASSTEKFNFCEKCSPEGCLKTRSKTFNPFSNFFGKIVLKFSCRFLLRSQALKQRRQAAVTLGSGRN
jgi:hypothetical protein